MKRFLVFVQICAVCARLRALPPEAGTKPPGVSLLFGGSWESGGNVSGRAQIILDLPAPGLSFRVQYTDRRKASSWPAFTESFNENSLASVSAALYHTAPGSRTAGSRLLYGMITTSGLAARIKNPRLRGAPFEELRAPSQSDLKTESASTAIPAFYLHLASPELELESLPSKPRLTAFGAFSLESEGPPGTTFSFSPGKGAFTAGTTVSFSRGVWTRLEAYYTGGTIASKDQAAWFSYKPALPERDFRLYAGSYVLHFPGFGLAVDGAWSETFAYGKDFYGNAALRFGDRPWRLSLAADGSGSRYIGPDGGENGAELRFAARLERRGRRSSLFRLDTLVRAAETEDSPGAGFWRLAEKPNRYSAGLSYRLPAGGGPFGVRSFSFSLKGDSRDADKESADAETSVSLRLFQLGADTRIVVSGLAGQTPGNDFSDTAKLGRYRFNSLRVQESLVWSKDNFQCKAGLGYTAEMKTSGLKALWDTSLALTLRGKHGWFSVKLHSPDFPSQWDYTISWLFRGK
ncbi:MAG: hypothetical protein LBI67_09205 [Treponema sp.]|jgi:hypothetical protein|nr:hypothetical protein [Treponema sp.]